MRRHSRCGKGIGTATRAVCVSPSRKDFPFRVSVMNKKSSAEFFRRSAGPRPQADAARSTTLRRRSSSCELGTAIGDEAARFLRFAACVCLATSTHAPSSVPIVKPPGLTCRQTAQF